MKRAVVALMMLFPTNLAAQEGIPSAERNQPATAAGAQSKLFVASDEAASVQTDSSADFLPNPNPTAPQRAHAKPGQPAPPPRKQKPKIPGSMVGYIDDAIVGSQIRIRFEAAFHNNSPDRAEFFYPQYAGLSLNAPGPNSVVADLNFHQLYFYAEYAPTKRFSFLTEVPVRWILPQNTVANTAGSTSPPNVNEAGLSDVAAGFKLAALASSNHYLTFQFKAYFSSGNASNGLGTNHYSVEPALLFYQKLSDRLALEAQLGDSHPIGGSFCGQPCIADLPSPPAPSPAFGGFAGDVFFYGVGPSYVLHQGQRARIAAVLELVGWRVLGGLQTICIPNMGNPCDDQQGASADGTNIVNLKVGARTSIGRRNSFYVGFGQAVTHAVWYKNIIRAEYRYSF